MAEAAETVTLSRKELDAMLAKVAGEAARTAAQQVSTELLASVSAKEGTAPDEAMLERMGRAIALAIAEVSDQGSSRKRVAPEVLEMRAAAHERMVALITAARDDGAEPEYRLVAKTYLSERFVEPWMPGPDKRPIPTEIIWKGAPNQAMRPVNAVAKQIYAAFVESIGTQEGLKGMDNRPFYMTSGGLVVKGDPRPQHREIPQDLLADDLKLTNQKDPTAPFVHVLGTVAAPARQNVVRRADQVA